VCVAWTLSGELFPPPVRIVGCPLSIAARYVIVFIELKAYPLIMDVHPCWAVLGHAIACALAVVFVLSCLPETLGLTALQITNMWTGVKIEQDYYQNDDKEREKRRIMTDAL